MQYLVLVTESRHACEAHVWCHAHVGTMWCVMSHMWMRHGIYRSVVRVTWICCVTYTCARTDGFFLSHTHAHGHHYCLRKKIVWAMSHVCIWHVTVIIVLCFVTRVHLSCHSHDCFTLYSYCEYMMSPVTNMIVSYPIYTWDVSEIWMRCVWRGWLPLQIAYM